MLLLNMWSSMRYRRSIDWAKEMGYVDRVMGAMKNAESRSVARASAGMHGRRTDAYLFADGLLPDRYGTFSTDCVGVP